MHFCELAEPRQLIQAVSMDHGAIEESPISRSSLAGAIEDDLFVREPDPLRQIVFHAGNDLGVCPDLSDSLADIRRVIGLKGISDPILLIISPHRAFQAAGIVQESCFFKHIYGAAETAGQRIKALLCIAHHRPVPSSKFISRRRISKASAYFFPIS